MNIKEISLILIVLIGSTIGIFYYFHDMPNSNIVDSNIVVSNVSFDELDICIDNITPITISDPMPVSEYLREYNMTKTSRFWRAIDGSSYIDPNHVVVQWYARNTILNESGLYYLNGVMVLPKYSLSMDNDYIINGQYIGDYWINADYYLSHNLTGDCEDFAIGIASILEAKGIPNMIVAVTNNHDYRHTYLQYYYNDTYYTADFTHPRYMIREDNQKEDLRKVWMFNIDTDYTVYKDGWFEYP